MKTPIIIVLLATHSACATSLKIEIFDNGNFNGYYQTLGNTDGCTNLTEDWGNFLQEVRSMKTDTCILIYKEADCTSYSYRLESGEYPDMGLVKHETVNFINAKSYNLCTSHGLAATTSLHVDLHGIATVVGQDKPAHQGLLFRYRHVCTCTNLSARSPYVGRVTAIENFHNCIILYEESNCQGRSLKLLGGYSPQSWPLPSDYNFLVPSASLAPCQPAATCHSLRVKVYKFILNFKITSEGIKAFSENITVGSTSKLRNIGTVTVSQLYEACDTIEESVEVTRIPGFSNPSATFTTAKRITFEVSGDHIVNLKKLETAITNSYKTSTDAASNGNTFIVSENREVKVAQKIELWPCSEHTVNSHITMVQHLPLEYEFYSTVSGSRICKTLTAAEIKEVLVDGLEYVQDVDNYTIMAKGKGTILMDFGLEVQTEGSGREIQDCLLPSGFCSREIPNLFKKAGNKS